LIGYRMRTGGEPNPRSLWQGLGDEVKFHIHKASQNCSDLAEGYCHDALSKEKISHLEAILDHMWSELMRDL
jgi:hypothetical protein